MVSIPLSRWKAFHHDRSDGRRLGQHFHDFMELHKIQDPDQKVWCDMLYGANDVVARQMIMVNLDQNN